MASDQKNTYPHFYRNQVLKSSKLNEYFAFLDRQTRLSRIHFMGCGIVGGLDFSLEGDALVVNAGVAVNKDGWFVQVRENTEYRYVAEVPFSEADFRSENLIDLAFDGGSRVAMICFRTEEEANQLNLNLNPVKLSSKRLDNYVVALACGKRLEYDSRCSQDSCDVNTGDEILETWPVLIPVGTSLFQRLSPISFSVPSRKEPGIECFNGNVLGFDEQILASAKLWASEIQTGMDNLVKQFQSFSDTAWRNLFSDGSLVEKFIQATERVHELVGTAVRKVPDYFVSFFGDMVTALNEFISEYNSFAYKYEVVPNDIPEDFLVYLGRPDDARRKDMDIYRSLFRNALDENCRKDSMLLERMLRRICILSESFIGDVNNDELAKRTFQLLKIRPGGRLSGRPVPFYYDTTKEGFFEAWSADNPCTGTSWVGNSMDKYLSETGSMSDEGWSIYPSAYQGKEISLLKGDMEEMNRKMRLSIDIVEAGLNDVSKLSAKEVELLSDAFAPLSGGKSAEFFLKVQNQEGCHGDAHQLAGILGTVYDRHLLEILQNGSPMVDNSYQKICQLKQFDEECMNILAKALYEARGKSESEQKINELSSALLHFTMAWRNSFVLTDKRVEPMEVAKAVCLAPIRRGCRVFLFTKPDGKDKKGNVIRTVATYGVVYLGQPKVSEEEPAESLTLLFRMGTKAMENGEYAAAVDETVNPYGDDKWNTDGNIIRFYPYQYDGSSAKKYETTTDRFICEISNSSILEQLPTEIEKKVPCIVLRMKANGTSWITLKIKDDRNTVLYSRPINIIVDNPVWNRIPVTEVTVWPDTLQLRKDDSDTLFAKLLPDKPTDKKVDWLSDNPSVVSVVPASDIEGTVTGIKEGHAIITASSHSDPDRQFFVPVDCFSYCFRMQTIEQEGQDTFADIPDEVNLYDDNEKWALSKDKVMVCPFSFDGTDYSLMTDNNVVCEEADEAILHWETVTYKKAPAILLKLAGENGTTRVKLKIVQKGKKADELYQQSLTVVVDNPAWSGVQVEGVDLTKTKKDFYVGQTDKLEAFVRPDKAPRKVIWTSDNATVVKVDENSGDVMPVNAGSTTLTATSKADPEKKAILSVRVLSLLFMERTKNKSFVDLPETISLNMDNKLSICPREYDGVETSYLIDKHYPVSYHCPDSEILEVTTKSQNEKIQGNFVKITIIDLVAKGKGKTKITFMVKGPAVPDDDNAEEIVLFEKTYNVEIV